MLGSGGGSERWHRTGTAAVIFVSTQKRTPILYTFSVRPDDYTFGSTVPRQDCCVETLEAAGGPARGPRFTVSEFAALSLITEP